MATFDANVALYEENIRKADSQRMLAGWQFLPFCRQKVRPRNTSRWPKASGSRALTP